MDRQICTSHRKRRAPTGAPLVTTLKYNHRKNPALRRTEVTKPLPHNWKAARPKGPERDWWYSDDRTGLRRFYTCATCNQCTTISSAYFSNGTPYILFPSTNQMSSEGIIFAPSLMPEKYRRRSIWRAKYSLSVLNVTTWRWEPASSVWPEKQSASHATTCRPRADNTDVLSIRQYCHIMLYTFYYVYTQKIGDFLSGPSQ